MNANAVQTINHWDNVQGNPIKIIFVCEFITAGGLNHTDLPLELLAQGASMRDALLQDLSELDYSIHTTVDARLDLSVNVDQRTIVRQLDDPWLVWEEHIKMADAVWLIAPETDEYLAKLTALADQYGKQVIGCGVPAIQVCSSKLATYQHLQQSGIATIETQTYSTWQSQAEASVQKRWLAKPDDGAGCEEMAVFDGKRALAAWLIAHDQLDSHVIQPFMTGQSASISCLMYQGEAVVLSCNQQLVAQVDSTLRYEGCIVNGFAQYRPSFEALASRIADALPSLAGYVAIDVIIDEAGALSVVEINPRLTTSYIGLREAIGCNPAERIIETIMMGTLVQGRMAWSRLHSWQRPD